MMTDSKLDLLTNLYKLVNEQLIVGFTVLNVADNKPHGIPIWIATDGIQLFFYSQSTTKKIKLLKVNFQCSVIFNYGSVEGICSIIPKIDSQFINYFKAFDPDTVIYQIIRSIKLFGMY
ncbi:MAG: hypothetical protein HeimC3_35330 [Candidatus Heimdallarchaeota archaeon LC_3]|nr:MAG: hypothetical protein HeimC3_35330 [Candidatus Heimdallarchaeota archaeon LC_3]